MSKASELIESVAEGATPRQALIAADMDEAEVVERQMLGVEKKELDTIRKNLESAASKLKRLANTFPKLKRAASLAEDARKEASHFKTGP